MSYRPIGKAKILDALFDTYCHFKANNEDERAKELAHLNVKLQECFDQINAKSVSVGYLAANCFFIGKQYTPQNSDKERKEP